MGSFGNIPLCSAARPALVVAVVLLLCCALVANGGAPDASAFDHFPTFGISMAPGAFASGGPNFTYTLNLSAGAYLVYGGNQYPITLVWGFYAVNDIGGSANNFSASGSDISEWKWEQKPNSGTSLEVAGWKDSPKKEAIETPATGSVSKAFTFSSLSFSGVAPVLGLHVTVSIPSGLSSPFGEATTGNIIPEPIPEPSGMIVLTSGLVCGLGFLGRNRRSARKPRSNAR